MTHSLSHSMRAFKKAAAVVVVAVPLLPIGALAIDPADLQKYSTVAPIAGDKVQASAVGGLNVNMDTIKKMKEAQDALDARDEPFNDLPNGVSYRQFREGKGSKVVRPGSDVTVQVGDLALLCIPFSVSHHLIIVLIMTFL